MVAEGPDPRVGSDLHLCAHLVADVCAVWLVSGKTNPVASVWAARRDQGGVLRGWGFSAETPQNELWDFITSCWAVYL